MKSRIDKIMKAMQKGNLDAIAVIAGPNMAYLTGGDFFLMERPTVLMFASFYLYKKLNMIVIIL
jgi:Xaa-Pro aminopeptidase